MPRRLDIIGKVFGRLTVLEFIGHDKHLCRRFRCSCVCGNFTCVSIRQLTSGKTQSCGCLRIERTKQANTRHGKSISDDTGTYKLWLGMWNRCTNPRAINYRYYGGVGVQVCERWRNYESFLSDMGPRPKDLTLDRVDPNKGYSPDNCRWATWTVQNNPAHKRKFKFRCK